MNNTRFWFFNRSNKMIIGNLDYASFEDARKAAREMNAEGPHATLGFVEFISNARTVTGGKVTTVIAPIQLCLSA